MSILNLERPLSTETDRVQGWRRKRILDTMAHFANTSKGTDAEVDNPEVRSSFDTLCDAPQAFKALDALTVQLHHDEGVAQEIITAQLDDTAELLLHKIEVAEQEAHRPLGTLNNVWSALKAWDETRTRPTEELAAHMLDNFRHGTGYNALNSAFERAKLSKNASFNEELDRYNDRQKIA